MLTAEQEAQEYTISNAYPAITKATGTQKSFITHGNELFVWRLFFDGKEGYYINNRKQDNPPKKGDVVYGVIGEDKFGNASFRSESRPLGQLPTNSKPAESFDDEKLDYLISLTERIAEKLGAKEVVLTDIDEEPIDLSTIPF